MCKFFLQTEQGQNISYKVLIRITARHAVAGEDDLIFPRERPS